MNSRDLTKREEEREEDLETGFTHPQHSEQKKDPMDPNIGDWDGPDDPENPLNWTPKKMGATLSIALITLLTYEYLNTP